MFPCKWVMSLMEINIFHHNKQCPQKFGGKWKTLCFSLDFLVPFAYFPMLGKQRKAKKKKRILYIRHISGAGVEECNCERQCSISNRGKKINKSASRCIPHTTG